LNNNDKPIKDNPSTKRFSDDLTAMSTLLNVGKLLGINVGDDVPNIKEMRKQFENLASLPDEFNSLFAQKGWIAYESFHVPTMEKAIEFAKQGDEQAAENAILEYYRDCKNIRMMIVSRGSSVEAYKPRKQLALYALDEYQNGR